MRVAVACSLALVITWTSASGQEPEAPAEPGLREQILQLYETAREAGEQVPQDVYEWLRSDLQRIGDWEYRVIDLGPLDSAGLEQRLNDLGSERWELIWVEGAGRKNRLILKRPTTSYLRQIPLSRLMKLIPAGDAE